MSLNPLVEIIHKDALHLILPKQNICPLKFIKVSFKFTKLCNFQVRSCAAGDLR